MKPWLIIIFGVFALSSCQPVIDPSVYETRYAPGYEPPSADGYVTLPGQAPVRPGSSSVEDAFDQAVQNRPTRPSRPSVEVPSQPAVQPEQSYTRPSYEQNTGAMDYTVKIRNATSARLFVEAQDANGTIYPCGFMQPKQSYSKSFRQAKPIASPMLVVVRDPDQPGAPELRRYRISAPSSSYQGATVQISIISGGRYTADVNGSVYVNNSAE